MFSPFSYETRMLLRKSILAGMCIGLGCIAYLSVDNKYVGAFLFSIGLFTICTFEYNLFTGKVCYAFKSDADADVIKDFFRLCIIWIFNFLGILYMYAVIRLSRVDAVIAQKAAAIWKIKQNDSYLSLFMLGVVCNICIYIAVEGYKWNAQNSSSRYFSVLLGVMVFILIGAEHCVADMFYFFFSDHISLSDFQRLLVITLGNAFGGLLFPQIEHIKRKGEKK